MEKLPESFTKHFPTEIGSDLVDYVTEVVFLHSRYLFTRREGRKQYAYCTHCHEERQTDGIKHGTVAKCSACGSKCKVRSSGRGRKNLIDEAYLVYYWRSQVNPQAIVARGIHLLRDYRHEYHDVKTAYLVKAEYLFELGHSEMYENWSYYSWTEGRVWGLKNWHQAKSIQSLWNIRFRNVARFCPHDRVVKAVQGTPFQYSPWKQYDDDDLVKFFALAAKYGERIEYLTKLGFKELVKAKLYGQRTYRAVNWQGKNPLKILKVTKQEMNELRQAGVDVDPLTLHLFQLQRGDSPRLSVAELDKASYQLSGYIEDLELVLQYMPLRRAVAYIDSQHSYVGGFGSHGYTLHTWRDYIRDCVALGLDLTDTAVLFPRDLNTAHQNTIAQVRVQADELRNKDVKARAHALQKYRFEALGLLIRPALSVDELISEGKTLHHCVGTYVEQYAKGQTSIFVLRKSDELDKPFYTVEIRSGQVTQCRGLRNCAMTDDVKTFMNLFTKTKLRKPKRERVERAVMVG